MRTDFGLYVMALICFIIAGLVFLKAVPQYLPDPATFEATAMTVIFAAAGLIFAILGYASRPKPTIYIPETRKQTLTTPSPPAPSTEETKEAQGSEQAPPTPPSEETAELERKKPRTRTRRKRTRRRRKKV